VLTSYPDGKVTAELLQLTEDSSIDRNVSPRRCPHGRAVGPLHPMKLRVD
jgi:hypothetical protein